MNKNDLSSYAKGVIYGVEEFLEICYGEEISKKFINDMPKDVNDEELLKYVHNFVRYVKNNYNSRLNILND